LANTVTLGCGQLAAVGIDQDQSRSGIPLAQALDELAAGRMAAPNVVDHHDGAWRPGRVTHRVAGRPSATVMCGSEETAIDAMTPASALMRAM